MGAKLQSATFCSDPLKLKCCRAVFIRHSACAHTKCIVDYRFCCLIRFLCISVECLERIKAMANGLRAEFHLPEWWGGADETVAAASSCVSLASHTEKVAHPFLIVLFSNTYFYHQHCASSARLFTLEAKSLFRPAFTQVELMATLMNLALEDNKCGKKRGA